MKVIGVIPARYSSTRFPGKMLAKIGGSTLIRRTYENALKCRSLDCLIIATDDERIAEEARGFGAEVVMTSPDCANGTERIVEALSKSHYPEAQIIVNVQGDEPVISPNTIDRAIEILRDDEDAVVSTAATEIKETSDVDNPSVVKCVFDKEGNALYFSRFAIPFPFEKSFAVDPKEQYTYYRHIGLYCYRKDFLLHYPQIPPTPLQQAENLEQLKILEHGHRIKVAVVSDNTVDVNVPEDISKLEEYLAKIIQIQT